MKKNYNKLLILGISIIIVGLALLIYSLTSYSEIKLVTDKIDFDNLDNNIHMSTSDKYFEHISILDMLNRKLEKNKNLPIKNKSCAYLDYSQHNIKSLYKLIFKNANEDTARRSVVEENIKSLLAMYDNYKTCRKTPAYKEELEQMLDEISNQDDMYYQGRMETFVNGSSDIEKLNDPAQAVNSNAQNQNYPQYTDQGIQKAPAQAQYPASSNTVQNAQSSASYRQTEQYGNGQNNANVRQEYNSVQTSYPQIRQ